MVVRGGRELSPSPSIDRQHFFTIQNKSRGKQQALRSGARRRYGTPQQRPSPSRLVYDDEHDQHRQGPDDGRDDEPSHMEGEHVCDYDTSATVLYELLESSSWERARARCRSHPEETRTWIVRKDKSLAVRWKLLPLHAAIIFQSPNYLVSAILEQYPAATHRKDDQDMLPLHLAFRHKHEDEDLLEILLVKFPKAVLLKDRRERVPLEHAREAKFSAKLMRLYADSVTAASRLVGKGHPLTPTTLYSSETMTAGERALLLKDHKDELAALKQKYELQLRKLKTNSSDQVRSAESDAEKRVDMIRTDYETQIRKLKDHHERNVEKLKESTDRKVRKGEQASEEKLSLAATRHAEELKKLRQRLSQKVETDKELTDSLEKEIAHLQVAIQEVRMEMETMTAENSRLNVENETFHDTLDMVKKQHDQFQELLGQQTEDENTARSIRKELIQTLTRLDEEKKYRPAMGDIIERIRRKIDQSIERSAQLRPTKVQPVEQYKAKEQTARYSRQEPSPERESPRPQANRLERARHHRAEDRRSKLSRNRQDRFSEDDLDDADGDYGEVRVLADEISAITDHSGY